MLYSRDQIIMFPFAKLWCMVLLTILGSSLTDKVRSKNERTSASIKPTGQDKLKVTIFYESECSDCVNFFRDQLLPNYEALARYTKLDFVPYGKATQKKDSLGNYRFDCQHGELECVENKLQACAIDKLLKKSPSTLDKFIICYMKENDKLPAARKCAKRYEIDLGDIESCANSKAGNESLARMGDRTHDFRPEVNWVPTIVFNNVYNESDSRRAGSDFKQVLCEKLDRKPSFCKKMNTYR